VPAQRRQEADVVSSKAKVLNDPHVSLEPDHVAGHQLLDAQLDDHVHCGVLAGHPGRLFPFPGLYQTPLATVSPS
jgi:hypothetical protein